MSSIATSSAAPSGTGEPEAILGHLCSVFFASLQRSDQRRRGRQYIHGLLRAQGRKSIRNLATVLGGNATEQGLHHFVSSSPWDWRPVRRSIARHFVDVCPPHAWVLRPMVIPKAGRKTVGVHRRFYSTLGQVLNAQEAVGVWAAGPQGSAPLGWRLHLPDSWLDDHGRRTRAAIPEDVPAESMTGCTLAAYLDMMLDWGVPRLPVVLDARGMDTTYVLRRLRYAGVPALTRISGTTRLRCTDRAWRGLHGEASVYQIMRAVREAPWPVRWETGNPEPVRNAWFSTVEVGLPGDRWPLRLIGVARPESEEPTSFWLTTLDAAPVDVLRLMSLDRHVDREFEEISKRAGIRDYTGRSFDGWHRHATLVSAAHAATNMIDRYLAG